MFFFLFLLLVMVPDRIEPSIFNRVRAASNPSVGGVEFFHPFTNQTIAEPFAEQISTDDFNPPSSIRQSGVDGGARPPAAAGGGGWFSGLRPPCHCAELNCGCCAGVNFRRLNFRRQYCTNFTYDPNEFAIQMDVLMNDESVYQNQVSARNPDPICIPIPRLPVGVDMCVKLFNVFTPGRNLHMCMDWMARVQQAPVLVLHFDCLRMGADGVALMKPEQNGGLPDISSGSSSSSTGGGASPIGPTAPDQTDADIFDTVNEIKV